MAKEEFNLSELIGLHYTSPEESHECILKEDVKEFIRLLKEEVENGEQSGFINDEQIDLREIINKLAGEKLI